MTRLQQEYQALGAQLEPHLEDENITIAGWSFFSFFSFLFSHPYILSLSPKTR
jgi:hypothetical protein